LPHDLAATPVTHPIPQGHPVDAVTRLVTSNASKRAFLGAIRAQVYFSLVVIVGDDQFCYAILEQSIAFVALPETSRDAIVTRDDYKAI
jgi:hypothetical protein